MKKENKKENNAARCSLYANCFSKTNAVVFAIDVFEGIKTGRINGYNFVQTQEAIKNESDKEKIKSLKMTMPAVTFGGLFKDSRTSELIESSYLNIIDFDDVPDLEEKRIEICQFGFVLACFISPSQNGLKVVVSSNSPNPVEYKKNILQLFRFFKRELGIDADTSKQNINDLCFLPHDPNIYINMDATVWNALEYGITDELVDTKEGPANHKESSVKKTTSNKIYTEAEIISIIDQIIGQQISIAESYNDWFRIACALKSKFGEDGREHFHSISYFSSKYDKDKTDKQYDACLKSADDRITIGTFIEFAKQHGIKPVKETKVTNKIEFFEKVGDKPYRINLASYYSFLIKMGFMRYFPHGSTTSILIRIENKFITEVNKEYLINFCKTYVDSLAVADDLKEQLLCAFYQNQSLFSENNLLTLNKFDGVIKRDTKDKAWLYFNNGICEITKDDYELLPYDTLDGYIWKSKILAFDFKKVEAAKLNKSEICAFLMDVCSSETELEQWDKFTSISSIIGYLIHDFKDPANTKAVILMDENDAEEPNGGRGKGIIVKIISLIVKVAHEDGKIFSHKSDFSYSQVEYDTKVLVIDDVLPNFPFENSFSAITDGMVVNKKHQKKIFIPAEDTPKQLLTCNYTLYGSGDSHERRKIEFELADYYNLKYTPQIKFGHLLFKDWDYKQWNLFYNWVANFLLIFLSEGLIYPPNANLLHKRLKASAGEEFIQFIDKNFKLNYKFNKLELYEEYCEKYKYARKINSQRVFTKCLRLYADANNLKIDETKSSSDYFFEFFESEKK